MRCIVLFLLIVALLSCKSHSKASEHVLVFAGMGMKDPVIEIIDSFNVKYPNIKVLSNWAASGTLVRQIMQGQIPDVFISANQKWVNYIDSLGFIVDGKIRPIAKNELVLVAATNYKTDTVIFNEDIDLDSLLKNGFLSIGDPRYVPVGAYAKQSLNYYNLYTSVEPKLMRARDVRSALWVVELGEAPVGFVFRSDAIASNKVKVLAVISPQSHKPIRFIATQCRKSKASDKLYDFFDTEKARNIWVKHGFY